jgi:hypothetical protein
MQDQAITLTMILALATIVEALVEFLVAPIVDGSAWSQATTDAILRYSAAAAGVALCIIYRADLLALMGLASPVPLAGAIITGLLMGRGANFLHDFASRWL